MLKITLFTLVDLFYYYHFLCSVCRLTDSFATTKLFLVLLPVSEKYTWKLQVNRDSSENSQVTSDEYPSLRFPTPLTSLGNVTMYQGMHNPGLHENDF